MLCYATVLVYLIEEVNTKQTDVLYETKLYYHSML